MTISALPTPPLRSDPANFAARADAFLAALPQFAAEANATAAAMNLNATSDTSATSVAIGLGAKSFQVSAGKSFQGGMYLVIADAAAPSVNSMVCQVTSYSGTTLAVMVLYVRGSGTKAAWVMGLSAPYDRDVGFQDGTQAAPGIAFEQDKDTGIRRPGADALALVTGGVDGVSLDSEGNLSARGNLRINNQQFFSSGSFGRFWGNAALAIGQAQFAGLYGPTITYNAKIVGGAWQSIGGGTATAMTMDEGIFSVSRSQSVGAADAPLVWTTALALDGVGNLGLGAVPSSWANSGPGQNVIQLKSWSVSNDVNSHYQANNAYYAAGGWTYISGTKRATLYQQDSSAGSHKWYVAAAGAAGATVNFSKSMELDSGGNLLLRAATSEGAGDTRFQMGDPSSATSGLLCKSASSSISLYASSTSSSYLSWRGGSFMAFGESPDNLGSFTERYRVNQAGELMIGTTASSVGNTGGFAFVPGVGGYGGVLSIGHSTSNVNGSGFLNFLLNGVAIGAIAQSGTTAVTYNTTSDHRLKTNVRPSDAKRFMQIKFCNFEWLDGRHDCGVIAHELQEIYPDLVSGEKDAVEAREVEVSPYVPAVTEARIVSPAVEAVAAVEAAEAVEASPAEYRTVETPEVVLIDGIETTIIRRSLLEIKPAVEAKPAVAAVEGVEGKEAVIETIVITPEQPAVTELREFPIYQQVNYIGLIGRMGTRLQLVIRQTDAQQELIEQQQVLIGTLTARLDALTERLEVLESAA